MLKFKTINYSPIDLIELLKANTAAIVGCRPNELFVNFKFQNNQISAEIIRKDKKELIIKI